MPDDRLLNLGNDDVRQFLTDFVAERIEQYGLDWYREDFNIAPLEYWQEADAPDRVGISEIRFVTNLYAMWDELLARFPHLAIDNCASGGRRIDLETIGAVPRCGAPTGRWTRRTANAIRSACWPGCRSTCPTAPCWPTATNMRFAAP